MSAAKTNRSNEQRAIERTKTQVIGLPIQNNESPFKNVPLVQAVTYFSRSAEHAPCRIRVALLVRVALVPIEAAPPVRGMGKQRRAQQQ